VTYKRYRTSRRGIRVLTFVAFLAMIMIGVEAGARAQQAAGKAEQQVVAQGVHISGVDVSGLTAAQVERTVRRVTSEPLTLTYGAQSWRFAPETLGADFQVDGAVRAALAAPESTYIRLGVTVNERRLDRWTKRFARRFDQKMRNAKIVIRGLRPGITRSQDGRKLYRWATKTAILSDLRAHDRGPLELDAKVTKARVARNEVGPAIVIRRSSNELFLYRGQGKGGMKLRKQFGVATGQAAYPTPLGSFKIVDKQENPWWYPPDSDWAAGAQPVPPGPGNPLGTRWMGLSEPLIGIHGTPDSASIGYSASHGCVRMLVSEAEWLFERVPEGTPVFILDA
jgi:L,D-transpeptidase catalytic domain/Putative peptidoglycan binding domain